MNWYFEALKKYAVFSGRARRKEYWVFFLFNLIINLVLVFSERATGLTANRGIGFGPLDSIYTLAVLIPSFAVAVRRIHDTNRSAWWLRVGLVPFIGFLAVLVFMCQDSQPGENQYGSNPKAVTA